MSDLATARLQEPILIFDRIGENRRKTRFLLFGLVLAVFPFLFYIALLFGEWIGFLIVLSLGEHRPDGDLLAVFVFSAVTALALAFVVAYVTYRVAMSMALSTRGARPLADDEEQRLRRIVENLCIGAGLPAPKLHLIESPTTNAYSTGRDPTSAALVVTRGLLEALDDRELEGVVAHELSQIGNEDIRPATLAGSIATILCPPLLLLFLVRGVLPRLLRRGQIVGIIGLILLSPILLALIWLSVSQIMLIAFLPLLLPEVISLVAVQMSLASAEDTRGILVAGLLIIPLYGFYVAPVIGFLMRRAACRQYEFRADADALLLSRHPSGLARALVKMSMRRKASFRVDPAVSHLYIVNPLGSRFWSWILATQPPLEQRLAALVRMSGIDPRELQDAARPPVQA